MSKKRRLKGLAKFGPGYKMPKETVIETVSSATNGLFGFFKLNHTPIHIAATAVTHALCRMALIKGIPLEPLLESVKETYKLIEPTLRAEGLVPDEPVDDWN